ncbi:MAG TPA: carbon-nitrogen hydrolase family protein, partial [Methanothrix sp.]|nr:carbon-nitrogen hydrolase family protein [Methanothrix sp.]
MIEKNGDAVQNRADRELRVALIHAKIDWKDKDRNIERLLQLNRKAASSKARIILNTELATTGYAFESRREIAPLTECIPGPTTGAFGRIARDFACYIAFGLAERDASTGIFYNSAAMIGPDGTLLARYRKASPAFRENLWAAKGCLPVPVVPTNFGSLALVICADSYSYRQARIAALQGAKLLLIPANWPPEHHNPEKFWRARALENGIYVMACNRTGIDKVMDCRKAESFVIDPLGRAMKQFSSPEDSIVYESIPLKNGEIDCDCRMQQCLRPGPSGILKSPGLLKSRRPGCYGNISLDPYSYINIELLLGLPAAAQFTAATLQFRPKPGDSRANISEMLCLLEKARGKAREKAREVTGEKAGEITGEMAGDGSEHRLNLAVFPELATSGPVFDLERADAVAEPVPGKTTEIFAQKAKDNGLFMAFGMVERDEEDDRRLFNSSVLVGPDGFVGRYRKVHLSELDRNWAVPGDEGFSAFDLPFARVGLAMGQDLLFPEASDSLAKLGADMLCVSALWTEQSSKFIWEARLGEQMHLAVANQWGELGRSHHLSGFGNLAAADQIANNLIATGESMLASYSRYPERISLQRSKAAGNDINILNLATKDSREKKFLENIDYGVLLKL